MNAKSLAVLRCISIGGWIWDRADCIIFRETVGCENRNCHASSYTLIFLGLVMAAIQKNQLWESGETI